MIYGVDTFGKKVSCKDSTELAFCPICEGELIPKRGEINVWHWAHRRNNHKCNVKPETPWHRKWKSKIGVDFCEVIFEKSGRKKIADTVTKNGLVIEYQHSSISSQEIRDRESFYGRMIWVFDLREPWENRRFEICKGNITTKFATFKWKHCWKTLSFCQKPIYLHLGKRSSRHYDQYAAWDFSDYDLMFRIKKFYSEGTGGGWGVLRETIDFHSYLSTCRI